MHIIKCDRCDEEIKAGYWHRLKINFKAEFGSFYRNNEEVRGTPVDGTYSFDICNSCKLAPFIDDLIRETKDFIKKD